MPVSATDAVLIAAAIGGTTAVGAQLIAQLLGEHLKKKSAKSAWFSDQRLKAYSELIDVASDHHDALDHIWTSGDVQGWKEVREQQAELHRVARQIRMVGPTEVAVAAEAVVQGHVTLTSRVEAAQGAPQSTPMWQDPVSQMLKTFGDAFDQAVQKALQG